MNILKQIPAYLLAIIFFIFSLNFILHFIPMPPATGSAGAFLNVIYLTGFLKFVKILEITFAILIVVKPTRALALLLIAPISVSYWHMKFLLRNNLVLV